MSTLREGKKKKQIAKEATSISWEERKKIAGKEEEAVEREIEELRNWTDMIDAMNDEQLKEYLQNRPEELKSVKTHKSKPRQRVQQVRKTKSSTSTGIMASVWKFHKEEED